MNGTSLPYHAGRALPGARPLRAMTDDLGGHMQIVKFRPSTEEELSKIEALRGLGRNVILGEALDWYLRTLLVWYEGHEVLFRRGDIVTEVRPPEPGKRWTGAAADSPPAATDECPPR